VAKFFDDHTKKELPSPRLSLSKHGLRFGYELSIGKRKNLQQMKKNTQYSKNSFSGQISFFCPVRSLKAKAACKEWWHN
jgi:hypothetical protein